MLIETITVGNNFTNCYLVGEKNREAMIIDPGAEADKITKTLDISGIKINKIINTHCHFDHIGANREIKNITDASLLVHRKEEDFLTDPSLNLSELLGSNREVTSPRADRLIIDGEEIRIAGYSFKVFHTPGHSPGSIVLYNKEEDILFSGDTIFEMGIGRTDFAGCDKQALNKSIENKILTLPEDTIVYPGHGKPTTIGSFKSNIWVRIRG